MNPGTSVFLGIDGGATHSFGATVGRDGNVLGWATAASLNFFGSGLAEARRNLKLLVKALEVEPGTETLARAVIGCAALGAEATAKERESLCTGLLPLDRTRVVSDSTTAAYGATLGQPGVLIISGTGSVVLARGETGHAAQIGGWGHILGDEGSAYWIAREAIRAAIAATEARGPATALVRWICRWFQVNELPAIVPLVHSPLMTKEKLAALSWYLSENVEPEDEVFASLRARAGRELATQALAAIRLAWLTLSPVPVYLVGGVIEHDAPVRESLAAALNESGPIRLEVPCLPPVLGAALLAMNDDGMPPTPEAIHRLKNFKPPTP